MFHVKHLLFLFLLLPLISTAQQFSTSIIEVKPLPPLPVRNADIDNFLNSFTSPRSISQEEKEWFYWTNYSRQYPRTFYDSVVSPILKVYPHLNTSYAQSLKRDLYAANALPFLRPSETLNAIAQWHADQLLKKKAEPSHTSPNGKTFQDRMLAASVSFCAGENISYGPANTVLALVFLYIDEKISNVGHRKSLMNSSYTELGIGISKYPNGNYMVIQDFSCKQ
ncbi:MAG: allergen family protein [Segetibacter sp.]|nr:allergen family protein [Segetibacter sp.]